MTTQYDTIIIGAGPGGIFTAYELSRLEPDRKIYITGRADIGEDRAGRLICENVREFSPLIREIWLRYDTIEAYRSDEKDLFLLGAFSGSAIVGSVNLEILPDKRLMLRQLAVHPQMRGQGIGSGLMELADRTARENGYREIELHARPTVMAMYERLGYVVAGEPEACANITLTKMIKTLD